MKDIISRITGFLGQRKFSSSNLGLKEIRPTDVFISSFPKSGNTWLRFIIANAISEEKITMKNINEFVPGLYNFRDEINENLMDPRYIKVHHSNFKLFPKTVYIHRDYRDVLVSFFHYSNAQSQKKYTWEAFLNSELLKKPFGTWLDHVKKALEHHAKHPDRILVLSYEKMLQDPVASMKELFSFSGIQTVKSIESIVELTNIQNLKHIEQEHGTVYDIPGLTFFRKGEVGQWKDMLTKDQLDDIFTPEMKSIYKELNYQIE